MNTSFLFSELSLAGMIPLLATATENCTPTAMTPLEAPLDAIGSHFLKVIKLDRREDTLTY